MKDLSSSLAEALEKIEQLESIIAAIPGHIYWKDRAGVVLGCNQEQAESLGFSSPEELLGKTDYDYFPKEEAIALRKVNLQVMETGEAQVVEELASRHDGQKAIYLSKKIPRRNKQGDITGLIGVSFDITAQKQTEQEARWALMEAADAKAKLESEEEKHQLESILSLMPVNLYWQDTQGVILGCNQALVDMLDLTSSNDMIGKTVYDFFNIDEANVLAEINAEVIKTGKQHVKEETVTIRGKERVYLSQKMPLRNKAGEITGIVGISLDITAQKEAEEREKQALVETAVATAKAETEEQIRRSVMILSGSIAHDLRTPLACVGGSAYCLNMWLPELVRGYRELTQLKQTRMALDESDLKNALAVPGQLNGFVDDMNQFIDASLKALSKSLSVTLDAQDLVVCKSYDVIDRVLRDYPFEGEEKKLIEYDRTYYFNFLGNPVLFIRVLFNLLKNALYQIRQNQKGKIYVFCSDGGEMNCIHFKDTAGGAPASVVETIFDGYKTTKKEGTGVGLSFCKLTMQSFGGDITCHSVEGDYIEFVMQFPKLSEQAE